MRNVQVAILITLSGVLLWPGAWTKSALWLKGAYLLSAIVAVCVKQVALPRRLLTVTLALLWLAIACEPLLAVSLDYFGSAPRAALCTVLLAVIAGTETDIGKRVATIVTSVAIAISIEPPGDTFQLATRPPILLQLAIVTLPAFAALRPRVFRSELAEDRLLLLEPLAVAIVAGLLALPFIVDSTIALRWLALRPLANVVLPCTFVAAVLMLHNLLLNHFNFGDASPKR